MATSIGRRTFLLAAASAAAALAGCDAARPDDPAVTTSSVTRSGVPTPAAPTTAPTTAAPATHPVATRTIVPPETPTDIVPASSLSPAAVAAQLDSYLPPALTTASSPAPHGTVTGLDGGNGLALTVDDGVDSSVVAAYAAFLATTGIRATFFVNGDNPSWTDNARALRPLVASGQVQLGNHTWSHPDLRTLSDRGIADELRRNGTFLMDTYGIDARPFYRPPFGFHDDRVDRVATEEGYSTTVMWYGSFADSGAISETTLLRLADTWVKPGAIVIGHANHPTVTHLFPQIVELFRTRAVHPVTLADVFTRH